MIMKWQYLKHERKEEIGISAEIHEVQRATSGLIIKNETLQNWN